MEDYTDLELIAELINRNEYKEAPRTAYHDFEVELPVGVSGVITLQFDNDNMVDLGI